MSLLMNSAYRTLVSRAGWAIALMAVLALTFLWPCRIFAANGPAEINQGIREYFKALAPDHENDLDREIRTVRRLAASFEREGFNKGAFMARLTAGRLLMKKPDHDRALNELEEASEIAARTHDIHGQGFTLLKMAELEMDRSNPDKAVELLEQAGSIVGPVGDRNLLARIRTEKAGIALYRGKLKQAATSLDRTLTELKDYQDFEYVAKNRLYRGRILAVMNLFEKAAASFSTALEQSEKTDRKKLSNIILVEQAGLRLQQEEVSKAKSILDRAISWFEKDTDQRYLAWAQTFMAKALLLEDKPLEAQKRLEDYERPLNGSDARFFRHHWSLCSGLVHCALGELEKADQALVKARETATELKLVPQAMETGIVHARVSAETGRISFGLKEIEKSLKTAGEFQAQRTLARAWAAKGSLLRSAQAYSQAIKAFERSFGLIRAKSPMSRLTMERILERGFCLTRTGYCHQGLLDAEDLISRTGPDKAPGIHYMAKLLKAESLAASGAYEQALVALQGVDAGVEKMKNPLPKAHFYSCSAQIRESQARLEDALKLLDSAQRSFIDARALESANRCLIRKVRILLDIKDARRASDEANRGYSVFWSKSSPSHPVRDRVVGSARGLGSNLFMAQYSQGFGPQGPGAKQYWDDLDNVRIDTTTYRSEPRAGKDPDMDRIIAGRILPRAMAHFLDKDFDRAESLCKEALQILDSHKSFSDSLRTELRKTLALSLVGQGKYEEASQSFDSTEPDHQWLKSYLASLSLLEANKPVQAAKRLEKAIADLLVQEKSRGLWKVGPASRRLRENLYESCALAHMRSAGVRKNSDLFEEAWNISQKLKMRRVFYRLFGSCDGNIPGVPRKMVRALRRIQFMAINRELRKEAGDFESDYSSKDTAWELEAASNQPSGVEEILAGLRSQRPMLADLLECIPPSREETIKKLRDSEAYISFLVTDDNLFGFRLSSKGVSARLVKEDIEDLNKKVDTLTRQASNPYRLRIREEFSELYQDLMYTVGFKFKPGLDLVVEVDGFLWRLPFEALMPGTYPDSHKERQAAQLLFDRSFISRTTSAFRFVNLRSNDDSKDSGVTCAVFADPDLDSIVRAKGNDPLLDFWKRSAREFLSSSANRIWSQKESMESVIGSNGKAYTGRSASRPSFVSQSASSGKINHIATAALIPPVAAGMVRRPFLLFTPAPEDPVSGFCDPDFILRKRRSNRLTTLTWINDSSQRAADGFILLTETLGLSGAGHVMAPLWPARRNVEKDYVPFLQMVYKNLTNGSSPRVALKKAIQKGVRDLEEKRGNRLNLVRFVIF